MAPALPDEYDGRGMYVHGGVPECGPDCRSCVLDGADGAEVPHIGKGGICLRAESVLYGIVFVFACVVQGIGMGMRRAAVRYAWRKESIWSMGKGRRKRCMGFSWKV